MAIQDVSFQSQSQFMVYSFTEGRYADQVFRDEKGERKKKKITKDKAGGPCAKRQKHAEDNYRKRGAWIGGKFVLLQWQRRYIFAL